MTVHSSWRDDAACRDADPDLFFPVGTTGPALRHIDEAKRICRACPAQTQCLAWALDHGVTDGVWGGTTADERRAIRRLASRLTIRGMTMATANSEQSAETWNTCAGCSSKSNPGFPRHWNRLWTW
jgi:WhiB family transcriptional regulator, redox-sensing transcriptional regulator